MMAMPYGTLLFHALGLGASKDTFWTTGPFQDGPPINRPGPGKTGPGGFDFHPNPFLETLVATLSMGPVGPSDRAGSSNATLLKATCDAGGNLLGPTRPLMSIDAKLALSPAPGRALSASNHIWEAASTISGLSVADENYTTHLLVGVDLPTQGFLLQHEDMRPRLNRSVEYVYRRWDSVVCGDHQLLGDPATNTAAAAVAVNYSHSIVRGNCPMVMNSTDQVGGVQLGGHCHQNTTQLQCCAMCKASPACQSWLTFGDPENCCLLANVTGHRPSDKGHTFCCMSAWRQLHARRQQHTREPCVDVFPSAGLTLFDADPNHPNCNSVSGVLHQQLITIFPVRAGFALLGELSKFVGVSSRRFSNLSITSKRLRVDVTGTPGERVEVTVLRGGGSGSGETVVQTVQIPARSGAGGRATTQLVISALDGGNVE